jgi:hypothetical protein
LNDSAFGLQNGESLVNFALLLGENLVTEGSAPDVDGAGHNLG